jgi:hypothetical protein
MFTLFYVADNTFGNTLDIICNTENKIIYNGQEFSLSGSIFRKSISTDLSGDVLLIY